MSNIWSDTLTPVRLVARPATLSTPKHMTIVIDVPALGSSIDEEFAWDYCLHEFRKMHAEISNLLQGVDRLQQARQALRHTQHIAGAAGKETQ